MGSRRKTGGDGTRLPAITRRSILGAASAAPVVTGTDKIARPADAVASAAAFLAVDIEINRLLGRWATLERYVIENHRWFELSRAERQALPEAREMFEIDDAIEPLFRRREKLLPRVAEAAARDPNGIAAKLAVAAIEIHPDENEVMHRLLDGALRELAAMRCPGCGGHLVAGKGVG